MSDFVCEVSLYDLDERDVEHLIRGLKAALGEKVRTRTLLRAAWELERRPMPPPLLIHTVAAPRQRKLA